MTTAPIDPSTPHRPLRLWPGVVIVALQLLGRFVVPLVAPDAGIYGIMGSVAGWVALVVWWVFFSRAPWVERIGAVVLMLVAIRATKAIVHESIATGAMGMLYYLYAIPTVSVAFVAAALASRRLTAGARRVTLVAAIVLACGAWALVRTGGFTSELDSDLAWRWAPTPEERLLAQAGDEPLAPPPVPAATAVGAEEPPAASPVTPAAVQPAAPWPGFRGPERDDVVRGSRIATDWSASPPVELWRRPVGPGWSSFAVDGERVYTQEQRGEHEVVSCYDAATGEPVWRHRDKARFWESNGGAGPRGTPTLSGGRVFTFGATGIVNALDAATGAVVWSRNAAADTATEVPIWGLASSPLVVGNVVLVAAAGSLIAYDLATGEPRWSGPPAGVSYSSPHLLTLDGVEQVVLLHDAGAISVAPADGSLLWEYPWRGYPIVQPALTGDGDVLISVSEGGGVRRVAVVQGPGGWTTEDRWTSTRLKPYFNDFVVHDGHAFGFDGSILASIDLANGERKWKGGRYGRGQLLLLADQGVLLVVSETGELALVEAVPGRFNELARFPALEGKSWSHPVLVGDLLLVRNGQQMAAFRLALAGG